MIIKRSLRSAMPSLGRCSVTSTDDEDEDDGGGGLKAKRKPQRKRPRPDPFPLEVLGDSFPLELRWDFAGDDASSAGVSTSSADASYCSGEVQSPGSRRTSARPSGGRANVISRRLFDSVQTDRRNKERRNSKTLESDFGVKAANSVALYGQEEKELYWACRNFNSRKYVSTSRSTLTEEGHCNVDEQQWQNCNSEDEEDGKEEKKRFVVGDIVWAQLGKKHPAWPAIIVHATQQGSESGLDLCVPGAILVMFFGCSGAGNKRVREFEGL